MFYYLPLPEKHKLYQYILIEWSINFTTELLEYLKSADWVTVYYFSKLHERS